jgi:hypothetical protein
MLIKPVYYLMVVLFVINAATDMRSILREKGGDKTRKEAESLKKILFFAGLTVLLVAALPCAGFLISSTLFIFLVLLMFKVESKAVLYTMPIVVAGVLYLLFEYFFGVELPTGVLGF